MNLKEKLEKLKTSSEFDDESKEQFKSWIKTLEEGEELIKLREHYLIKRLLDNLMAQIETMEGILKKQRELSETKRLNLLDRIDLYNEFINLFSVEDRTTSIQNALKDT